MKKMILVSLLTLIILIIIFFKYYTSKLKAEVYYNGPVSEYFNGEEFLRINPRPTDLKAPSFTTILKYFFAKNPYGWKEKNIEVHFNKPEARINEDIIRVYWINHSTLLIQTNGLNIITDPIYSKIAGLWNLLGPKRHHAPGIKFEDLPTIDIILISHSHYDHMDFKTIKKIITRDKSQVITLAGNDYLLHKENPSYNVKGLLWNEGVKINNIQIDATPAYHWTKRGLYDDNKALWGGFVIITPKHKLFFAGDTAFYNGQIFKDLQKKYNSFDIALLPIGAYMPNERMKYSHTTPLESVKIHKILNSKKSIGIHWGTFQLSQETYYQPKDDLKKANIEENVNPEDFITLIPGDFIEAK
jgi:L-ascorbate metabolism protein UlaG (beta-lactamase superfamily)